MANLEYAKTILDRLQSAAMSTPGRLHDLNLVSYLIEMTIDRLSGKVTTTKVFPKETLEKFLDDYVNKGKNLLADIAAQVGERDKTNFTDI